MPKQKKYTSKEILQSLTKYAIKNRCACSACRLLREYRTQSLQDRIKDLEKQLKVTKISGGKT